YEITHLRGQDFITSIYQGTNGTIWVGTNNHHIYKYHGRQSVRFDYRPLNEYVPNVTDIYTDDNATGSIVVRCDRNCVAMVDTTTGKVRQSYALESDMYMAIQTQKYGLIASSRKKLNRYDRVKKEFVTLDMPHQIEKSYHIFADHNQTIWIDE